jgi:DNA helicase-2/ATP-dependent DNA helicase PcrA
MKDRISKLIGNGIESRLILGTFHSVCRRYLVTYGHLIGIRKGFGIADSTDTTSIIKRIIKRLGLTIDPKKAQSRISSSKSRGLTLTELGQQEATKKDVEQQEFAVVFGAYENQLAQSNLLDYDDLLLRSVDLLRQYPSCVSNVEVVLIDEFQDTNLVQFDLMRLFAAKHKRITTVGDPDQSIYGWRSAEIKNLKRMQKQYPDTVVIHLEDNYRSSGAILLAAQEVIEQDESRPPKSLLPTHCPGTVPVLRRLPSADIEAQWIVSEILRVTGLTGNLLTYSDFAILLRSASLSRQVESAMGRAGIPYRMVGGQRFFDRVEIKILLDYLRVLSQPHNNDALSRILNIPARGVGTTTAKGLLEEAEVRRVSLWIHIRDAIQGHGNVRTKISKPVEHGLGSFINIILTARKIGLDDVHPQSPEDLLRYIIKKVDFQTYLHKYYPNDHETRWANVEELVAQAAEYPVTGNGDLKEEQGDDRLPKIEGLEQEIGNAAEEALAKFLANVALATELQREDEEIQDSRPLSQVTISTIHAAKGLEWAVVFVPSAYDGCIPHSRAEDTDEERRLLYVAMTRAKALLYMSCPKKNSQREETTLSSFLSTKKVGQFLTNKGPTVDLNTVYDISRILRRGSPSKTEVVESSKKLQNGEDSLWPLNGEEDHKSIQARWSKWELDAGNELVSKRRRLEDGRKENGAVGVRSAYLLSSIGSATTMQSSSAFSCNGSGFISAATQLHQEKVMPAKAKGLTSEGRGPSSIASNSKARSGPENQGNLVTLWGKRGKFNVETVSAVSLDVPQEDLDYQTAVKASLALAVQTSNSGSLSMKRKPLSAIPQTLASHRLPANMSSTRPYLTTDEAEPAKKQYVFLSSSPPPVEGLSEVAEAEHELTLQHDATKAATNIRPAKTFHMTSVTQLQAASLTPKRTLGVRRSMEGWAARTNHGFSVPKIAGPKP